jgi:hypothetical protein
VVAASVLGMRDLGSIGAERGGGGLAALPSLAEVRGWTRALRGCGRGLDDEERIDLIRALEELRCAVEGAQAEVTTDFVVSQRDAAARRGVPVARRDRGVAAQVALAKRESHARGQRDVALAMTLRTELTCTGAALREGRITAWKATLVARETACLSLEHRQLVDEALAGDPARIEAMGDREVVAACQDLAARFDPAAVAERRRRAEADRHTSLRPAPDTMTWLGALLPVKDGVAVHKALLDEADRKKAAGDPRSRGAIMADTLVDRILRPHLADTADGARPPLMINVVVSDQVLLGDKDGSGYVDGHGEVPGDLLREWIAEHGVADWVRRLYQRPGTGDLVAMDSQGRRFEGKLAEFLRLRDRRCRNRWCNAPIRHLDHAKDVAKGGRTSADNGQGLCEACNHAKQADGWSARAVDAPVHTIEVITPTGHHYLSTVPTTGPPIWMELYPQAKRVA